jgi:hypothetical protein
MKKIITPLILGHLMEDSQDNQYYENLNIKYELLLSTLCSSIPKSIINLISEYALFPWLSLVHGSLITFKDLNGLFMGVVPDSNNRMPWYTPKQRDISTWYNFSFKKNNFNVVEIPPCAHVHVLHNICYVFIVNFSNDGRDDYKYCDLTFFSLLDPPSSFNMIDGSNNGDIKMLKSLGSGFHDPCFVNLCYHREDRIFVCNNYHYQPKGASFNPHLYDPLRSKWEKLPPFPNLFYNSYRYPNWLVAHVAHNGILYIWRKENIWVTKKDDYDMMVGYQGNGWSMIQLTSSLNFNENDIIWKWNFLSMKKGKCFWREEKDENDVDLDYTKLNKPKAISIPNRGILLIDPYFPELIFYDDQTMNYHSFGNPPKLLRPHNPFDDLPCYGVQGIYDEVANTIHYFIVEYNPRKIYVHYTAKFDLNSSITNWLRMNIYDDHSTTINIV